MKCVYLILLVSLGFTCKNLSAQADSVIRVHFLYGSRPAHAFRHEEREWFGGKLGGHVGIEYREGIIIDFVPSGEFHVFPNSKDFHSRFVSHSPQSFYALFGGEPDSMQRAIVEIPISKEQRFLLDSLVEQYIAKTPYDYAFFGMRCGAAAYDILAQIGILTKWKQAKIQRRIFYPRRLRKRLFDAAKQKEWNKQVIVGTGRRNWEKDRNRHHRELVLAESPDI
jgi:hypothetical protein